MVYRHGKQKACRLWGGVMDNRELTIKYNIDWNGKPYSTDDRNPKGVMNLFLDRVFQTYKTKAGVEKCFDVTHRRKILKFIIQVGSDENIQQLHNYLAEYSKLWLKEYEKILAERR